MFFKIGALNNFGNFTGKHYVGVFFREKTLCITLGYLTLDSNF